MNEREIDCSPPAWGIAFRPNAWRARRTAAVLEQWILPDSELLSIREAVFTCGCFKTASFDMIFYNFFHNLWSFGR